MLGLTEHKGGRVAVYGDSNCLDSSHMRSPCFRLLAKLLQYVATVSRKPARHVAVHPVGCSMCLVMSAWLPAHACSATTFAL